MNPLARDGGPAQPSIVWDRDERGLYALDHHLGLSARAWLAGQALSSYLAAHAGPGVSPPEPTTAAARALAYADALLQALAQPCRPRQPAA